MNVLAGKLALITGASRGIGLAIAEQLRDVGAQVVRLARSLRDERGPHFTDFQCDVTDELSVERSINRVIDELGVPQIVVNNAGVFLLKPLSDTSADEFQQQLAVNLVGPFLVLRELLPHLTRAGGGQIVTIGSVADYRVFPGNAAYGASKQGVRTLHEVLLEEIAGTGIRATLLSPGPTDTRLWDPLDPDKRDDLPKRAEMLQPKDIAEAVLFAVTRPQNVNVDVLRLMPAR